MIGTLGLGMGGIQSAPPEEIEAVVSQAIENGINFFDLCAGGASVYEPFGRAIRGKREKVYFQLHFGAVYNAAGEYGWSRDLSEIRRTFAWEMKALGTDHADFWFLVKKVYSFFDEIVYSCDEILYFFWRLCV